MSMSSKTIAFTRAERSLHPPGHIFWGLLQNLMKIQCSFQRALGNEFDGFGSEMDSEMDPKWEQNRPKMLFDDGVGEGFSFGCVLGFIFG